MKNLLILSPRFAPDVAADNQRVHLVSPWLQQHGWRVHVARVDGAGMGLPQDAALAAELDRHVECRTVQPISLRLARTLGIGNLASRGARRLDRMVRRWHREARFDLVFASTTEFGFWPLALAWKQALGLPYVLDWQDPWWSDYHTLRPHLVPPGGRLKYFVQQCRARHAEPGVAQGAAHHVCVSSHYVRMLRDRYPDIEASRFSVMPFPHASAEPVDASADDDLPKSRYWAYAGRGGDDMRFSLSGLFAALAAARKSQPLRFADLRLKFVGTSYAHPDDARPSILPLANAHGVGDMVDESPSRVSQQEVQVLLAGAEALIVPGSDDAGYVASKIQTCLALDKPMLAIFHHGSDVQTMLAGQAGVVAATFDPMRSGEMERLSADIAARWLDQDVRAMSTSPRRREGFAPESMAQRLAGIFDTALNQSEQRS